MRRTLAVFCVAAVIVAVGAFVAVRTTYAGAFGGSIYSFPHEPHLSAATVDAALAEAASIDRTGKRPGGGGKVDAECRVCHDYNKSDESHLSGCMEPCHRDSEHLVQRIDGAPTSKGPKLAP